jgi:hypothetical protein
MTYPFFSLIVSLFAGAEAKNEFRPAYPSSAKTKHDWDALLQEVKKEEAEEKPEGDAALQKVFADIYANASDETRRAMNKSYVSNILRNGRTWIVHTVIDQLS